MARAVVALGSNLGNRERALSRATAAIAALAETQLLAASNYYETEPVDVPPAFRNLRFLNAVVLIETSLAPLVLLRALLQIEADFGRVRTVRNGPRPLDLDLILYAGVQMATEDLTLPHPRAHLRDFVLRPLADLRISREHLLSNHLPENL